MTQSDIPSCCALPRRSGKCAVGGLAVVIFCPRRSDSRVWIMLSEDSRGWLWAAVLLLVAVGTCLAVDPAISTTTSASPTTNQTSATTNSSTITNGTTVTTSKTTLSSTTPHSTTTTTLPPPPPPSPTTKGSTAASTSSSTTVTSKGTSQSPATSPTTTAMASGSQKTSGFDLGSFIGGIVLTVGILAVIYFGCRFYNSRRGVRYRTIDEHEAII